jgi:hypothetical protein
MHVGCYWELGPLYTILGEGALFLQQFLMSAAQKPNTTSQTSLSHHHRCQRLTSIMYKSTRHTITTEGTNFHTNHRQGSNTITSTTFKIRQSAPFKQPSQKHRNPVKQRLHCKTTRQAPDSHYRLIAPKRFSSQHPSCILVIRTRSG